MAAVIWLCTMAVWCGLIALSDQIPVESLSRHKDFLQDFGAWLKQAEAAKHVSARAGPPTEPKGPPEEYAYGESEAPPPDSGYWKDLAMMQELDHEGEAVNGELFVEADWPETKPNLGDIGGVATNGRGDVVIFHRADRQWETDSFDNGNVYAKQDAGPISKPTMVTLNGTNGATLPGSWGQNMFYLPHGLTIDKDGNHWVTDVALHQVFKFGENKAVPEKTWGTAFEPASNNDDLERFCKPTDVAVASDGSFFVADGYCNSRVVKYSSQGVVLFVIDDAKIPPSFPPPRSLRIPHSLALLEDLNLICVADRENKRILCFNHKTGALDRFLSDETDMGRVYAITYKDGLLYAVTALTDDIPGSGFTIDPRALNSNGQMTIIAVWSPAEQGFEIPHDLDVSQDGTCVYVGEIGPNIVWKFDKTE